MIKITKYCYICDEQISENFNVFLESPNFYQLSLPEQNSNGEVTFSKDKKDICKNCFKELLWELVSK